MSSPARIRPATRWTTWTTVGLLAAALAALAALVAAGWGPLARADVRAVLAADDAVVSHAAAVTGVIAITDVGSPVSVDALTVAAVVGLFLRRHRRAAAYVLLVRLVALGLETALKNGVGRPRPALVAPLTTAAGFSFPSGHTTGTTALWTSLLIVAVPVLHGRARAIAVLAVVLLSGAVAASRVLLGVHYPSDVVGGLLAGVLVAVLLAALLRPHPVPPDPLRV